MESIKEPYYRYLRYFLAKDDVTATSYDKYLSLAYAVRSEMMDPWIETQKRYHEGNLRRVYFLSTEYVIGRSLHNNIVNLGIEENVAQSAKKMGFSLDEVYNREDDFDLGNGVKGRIAACSLDAMASQGIPAIGYGLRYDMAHFRQVITHGEQYEKPYDWLHKGHPWEIIRPEYTCPVEFNGECAVIGTNAAPQSWKNTEKVYAVPYDMPIPGYCNGVVNTLRLWSARAEEVFPSDYVNHGDYIRACSEKDDSGMVTKILFPDESVLRATEERLKQQFFFISASLQDILRRYHQDNSNVLDIDKKMVIQLNGTGCALAIPEFMRILIDVEKISWDDAWRITQNVFAFCSHAIRKDDSESWPVYMMSQAFPRHMGIIFEINQRHLDAYRRHPNHMPELVPEMSLIEEGEVKRIRIGNLAVIGSFVVNGVSRVQTDILQSKVFPAFAAHLPEKFISMTTGIAHRRWVHTANAPLSELLTELCGDVWLTKPSELSRLSKYFDKKDIGAKFALVKERAKKRLAVSLEQLLGISINEHALFDVHCQKFQPAKRQVLAVLGIIHRYLAIKNGSIITVPRVHIFAGKATPSDRLGKQTIHLINVVADLINRDPDLAGKLQVIFVPDYTVSWGERIIPAADIAEHTGAPHAELAGTSIIKFAINGAIPIASRSGVIPEFIETMEEKSLFAFGPELSMSSNGYKPWEMVKQSSDLKNIFSLLDGMLPTVHNGQAIFPLVSSLRDTDEFFVLRDFAEYIAAQNSADELFLHPELWRRRMMQTIARAGAFSVDLTIQAYAHKVWNIPANR